MNKHRKPKGIIFLSIIFFLLGVRGFFEFYFAFGMVKSMLNCRSIPFIAHTVVLLPSVLYLALIILSPALFMLKSWARKCSIILSCLIILNILLNDTHTLLISRHALLLRDGAIVALKHSITSGLAIFIKMVIFSFAIYYLNKARVKEMFKE